MVVVEVASKIYPRRETWNMFSKSIFDRFDWESNFLDCLIKLQKIGIVKEYIAAFEKLATKTDGLGDEFYLKYFISGLKEAIQTQIYKHHPPTSLDACRKALDLEITINA